MVSQVAVAMMMCCLQFLHVDGRLVLFEPPHVRVSAARTNLTFTCMADNPLTACQFSWWDSTYSVDRAGHVLDLSRGQQSLADPAHLNSGLLSYGYSGRGLHEGECGLRLEVKGWKTWLIACRVRADHGWVYNSTTLYAATYDPIPHTLEPREVVALQGGVANISLKAQGRLDQCYFRLPGRPFIDFNKGAASPDSTGRHLYQGAGLEQGDCSFTLTNISPEDNGVVEGVINKGSSFETRHIPLILARPPTSPVLQVLYNGADFTATCTVEDSRPVANITWVMGHDVIRQDSEDDSPVSEDDAWRWPWTAGSTSQRLTRRLQPQDNGKVLKCSVSHVALTEPLQASEVISFTGSSSTTVSNTTPSTSFTANPSMTPNMLDVCQELWARASQLQNTCCIKDGAGAAAAEVCEEIGRLDLEAAKSRARQEEAKARAAEVEEEAVKSRARQEEANARAAEVEEEAVKSRARQEEAWAKTAEEELQFEREWHKRQLQ